MLRVLLTIATVAAALALVPAAGAAPGHTGGGTATPAARPTVEIVRVVKPQTAFDFADAGIGAALGAAALAVLGGLVIVLHRDRSRLAA
jgi:hypothetical protein